ncbi:hypothetical protein MPTK1_1g26520 [Marchantia polymorpha subsp. ruderalis]|uniref:Uncharacterized protein n=2 Tax=Marchantia polymorpha TaxID=3197 RepID=A0A176WKQ8_MARPO|nr:hypothetical protein AXG93_4689s1150 [Marchantia polymorpha subsp. ruderalis]PTQ49771.1 hypothetical protein MARPO_0002s0226 [Marchantia polymorpha]BBN00113.1 hypothetical protein Mp_1g26520 [Marchantia polymorpha subsp. ruderalis]|eukprot:PTQ49771.1 hypothetical protein MARPO_0002s0226 [Marchantia polymorpha]
MVKDGKRSHGPTTAVSRNRDACNNCRKELEDKIQTWRSVLRGVALALFLLAFGVGFYFTFTSMPNMSVHRVYLDHGRRDFAVRRLYNESVSYGNNVDVENGKNEAAMRGLYDQFGLRVIANKSASSASDQEGQTLTCPCTKTSLSWTEYTHFYFVSYERPDRKPYLTYIFPPELDGKLGGLEVDNASAISAQYVGRAAVYLQSHKDFCSLLNTLPADLLTARSQIGDCQDLVGPLLSSDSDDEAQSRWKDSRASFHDSPVLLDQKLLLSTTLRLLSGYIRGKRALMESGPTRIGENGTNRNMFLTGLTDLWTNALDALGANSSCSDADFFATAATRAARDFAAQEALDYPFHFAVLLDQGQTFLGVRVNWTEYYVACAPRFCDALGSVGGARRAFAAVALLGGLGTCVLLLAHLVLWPLSDSVLVYFCRQSSAAAATGPSPPLPARAPRPCPPTAFHGGH